MRHSYLEEIPVPLRRHETDETSHLVAVALFQPDPRNHRRHEPAVLGPAHLGPEQRLPGGGLEVLGVDESETAS